MYDFSNHMREEIILNEYTIAVFNLSEFIEIILC